MRYATRFLSVLGIGLSLSGCYQNQYSPSVYDNDICRVVRGNYGWATALRQAERDHGLTPGTVLSIVSHESSFKSHARPPRELVLGFIPVRTRTEYGYGQVKDATWRWYLEKKPGLFRSRTSLVDTIGFMTWYYDQYRQIARQTDQPAYDFYLAYHEGLGGYKRLESVSPWLDSKAQSVQDLADRYDMMLRDCL